MGQSKIDSELTRFHGNVESHIPLAQQATPQFIVWTSSCGSVGLTLAEALSVIMFEPDYDINTVIQSYYRHCRQGNKNKVVYTGMLYIEGNATEERILMRTELRQRIQSTTTRTAEEASRALAAMLQAGQTEVVAQGEIEV